MALGFRRSGDFLAAVSVASDQRMSFLAALFLKSANLDILESAPSH